MNVLILSCGTGGGHNSAGRAVARELADRGHAVTVLNPYSLRGDRVAGAVDHAYVGLVQKAPSAFGAVYRIGDAYRHLPVRSPVYHLNRGMRPILRQYLQEHSFDAIAMTHLFPAEILTGLRRQGYAVPATYFIATDYTCIPFTEETECDAYVIPSPELRDEYIRRGLQSERLYPLGIPVHPDLYRPTDRAALRSLLGLSPDKRYFLIAGGSVGAGRIGLVVSLLTEAFDRSDTELIVVCGNNQGLYERMSEQYGSVCTVLGHTDRMPDYLRACDLFLSKPGGLSTTESAVAGIPLILMPPIPGCETHNLRFFTRHGMALPVGSVKSDLIDACKRLCDPQIRAKMLECQKKSLPQGATAAICDLIEQNNAQKSGFSADSSDLSDEMLMKS